MKKFLTFILVTLTFSAQDINISIGEESINSFISALGTVEGKGKLDLDIVKIPYTYIIKNGKITLLEKKVLFSADISLNVKGTITKGQLVGKGNINYNKEKRILVLTFNDINLLGLEELNLGEMYKPYFELPFTYFDNEKITVKNGNKEIELLLNIKDENLEIKKGMIIVSGNIDFERK